MNLGTAGSAPQTKLIEGKTKQVAFAYLIVALVLAASGRLATSASAEATQCDMEAASPLDPNRVAAGKSNDEIDVRKALPACESALHQFPNDDRFAYQLARVLSKKGEYARAAELYRAAAERGYAAAQNNLGNLYLDGRGVPKDANEAFSWVKKAAEQGLAPAQYNLALYFYKGNGTERNLALAQDWAKKAADQAFDPARKLLPQLVADQGSGTTNSQISELAMWEAYQKREKTLIEQVINYTLSAHEDGQSEHYAISGRDGRDKCVVEIASLSAKASLSSNQSLAGLLGVLQGINGVYGSGPHLFDIREMNLNGFQIEEQLDTTTDRQKLIRYIQVGDEQIRLRSDSEEVSGSLPQINRLERGWHLIFDECPPKKTAF